MLTAAGLVAIAANEMQRMLRNWLSVRRTGPALDRSELLLSQNVSSAETEKGFIPKEVEGEIEFKDVAFGYPEKEDKVLKGLSFSVKPGEAVALVGPSGSGKSTVVDLLLRLYEPESGAIFIDGEKLSTVDAGWLRSQIAIVSQDVQLRNGSLADNLRIAKPEATDEELISALQDSGLGDFLLTLPEGLNTLVGERGSLLSGGQKQRLSLARALVKDAAVLVLDEASSALDPITEVQVNKAINKRKSKQTLIIISHRLSTVLAANRVIVIENGVMIEDGVHEELLKSDNGVYSRLFKREADIGTQAFSS